MDSEATEPVTVGVFGAAGKMGSVVCRAVEEAADLQLVAAVDPTAAGRTLGEVSAGAADLTVVGSVDDLTTAPDVMVDFTHLEAARSNLSWCAENGVHAVVGTTGFTEADLERFRSEFVSSSCLIAPNFAIGAILMMRFAEMAAPWFETAEVLEFHHEHKLDAPSGTAMRTVERMAEANADWLPDPTVTNTVEGARGGRGPAGIRVHAIRMRGMVAHQEVLLGATGQTLSIRHDSYDRESFMPGVVLAVRRIADLGGVTIGLDALLDA